MTLRVLIVDDHPVVREGLRTVLSTAPDIAVAGECADGEEAVAATARHRLDVVLMDLRLPGIDGVEAARRIVAAQGPAVLMLTTYDAAEDIVGAVEAGACGYLLKDSARDDLLRAVRSAGRGETVLCASASAKLAQRVRWSAAAALSPREGEVLGGIAQGRTNAEIGRSLFIGEATVKSHVTRIFEKLGVRDRTSAVTTAIARGILPPPQ